MSGHLVPNLDQPVPVFPLPNLVMFPRVVQFVHLFEPRYRLMFQDLLEREPDERLIAVAHLRPGFTAKYHTHHAEIDPMLCVSLAVRHECLDDGRYNLLVRGVCRARVRKEIQDRAYRRAWVEGLREAGPVADGKDLLRMKRCLHQTIHEPAFRQVEAARFCQELFESDLDLGDLTDQLAFYLLPPETIEAKQLMLNELDVVERASILLKELQSFGRKLDTAVSRAESWPPPSSAN